MATPSRSTAFTPATNASPATTSPAATSPTTSSPTTAVTTTPSTTPAAGFTETTPATSPLATTPETSVVATTAPASTVIVPPSSPAATSILTVSPGNPVVSTIIGSSQVPQTVIGTTSVITASPASAPGQTGPVVVTSFSTASQPTTAPAPTSEASSSSASATSSGPASLQNNGHSGNSNGGGLSTGGTVAVAVVVPVVAVALLVAAAIFFFRRRKQKKTAQEARRKEVEEYGYNPNNDPTLPAVGGADSPDMTEDNSGYRGWGNNPAGSGRKPSTNLSSGIGMAVSDDGQHHPVSPDNHTSSDGGHSEQPLVDGYNAAPVAGAAGAGGAAAEAGAMRRGPSNASSQYSAAGQTDDSEDRADHGYETNYSQFTPYRPGATNYEDAAQPVIQDVSARRNTKIENPSTLPQRGNSGIAANF
ncbi:MAG: hypothetical protein Q9159_006894 [Coniocarpon cinnabarinum]